MMSVITDLYPEKSRFEADSPVSVRLEGEPGAAGTIGIIVRHLGITVHDHRHDIGGLPASLVIGVFPPGGYEVEAGGRFTAFDVSENPAACIRYGFLSGFSGADMDDRDVRQLLRYHITAVQFYDWMYRHHEYLPPSDVFVDPLGRTMDFACVRAKIGFCRKYGIRAVAYGAVYGAGLEYCRDHPEELLYGNTGEMESLAGFLGICDISPGSPWSRRIIGEYVKAVRDVGFDGIHMDQYGAPKDAFTSLGVPVDVSTCFAPLIERAREAVSAVKKDCLLIFNCVNDWPVEKTARAPQDAVYIEVWEPNSRYRDLSRLVRNARALAPGKTVILAAYIGAFAENCAETEKEYSALLVMSVIFASGGTHLALGEENGILSDPYYVRYSKYSDAFGERLRRYYDFIVKYREALFGSDREDISWTHACGINREIVCEGVPVSPDFQPGTVGIAASRGNGLLAVNFVNLTGVGDDRWNIPHGAPGVVRDLTVKLYVAGKVISVRYASPDIGSGTLRELPFHSETSDRGAVTVCEIPGPEVWGLLLVTTGQSVNRPHSSPVR